MGIGQVIKNVAGGVGSAIHKTSQAIDAPFVDQPAPKTPTQEAPAASATPTSTDPADTNGDGTVTPTERHAWEVAGHALTPASQGGRSGFELPDIENATDTTGKPNPFYIPKTRKGAKGVDEPNPDYVDAARVHQAMEALDRIHTENNPHIDYAKEYQGIIDDQARANAQPKRGNALSAFAIALGAGPQAAAQYGATNRAEDESDATKEQNRIEFKKSLVDAHVKQLVEEGKWKEALRANEISTTLERQLSQSAEQRKHENRMEESQQLIGGRQGVADTQAHSRIRAAQVRVDAIGHQTGLTGQFMKSFQTEMGKRVAQLTTGLTNDPDSGVEAIPEILRAAEEIADNLKAEQDKATPAAGGAGTGHTGGGKMVQMYKGDKPYGAPISPDEFKKRGGAAAAQTHGYTFKMQ